MLGLPLNPPAALSSLSLYGTQAPGRRLDLPPVPLHPSSPVAQGPSAHFYRESRINPNNVKLLKVWLIPPSARTMTVHESNNKLYVPFPSIFERWPVRFRQ